MSEWVRLNDPINTLQVISETSLSSQSFALLLYWQPNKNNQVTEHTDNTTQKVALFNSTTDTLIKNPGWEKGQTAPGLVTLTTCGQEMSECNLTTPELAGSESSDWRFLRFIDFCRAAAYIACRQRYCFTNAVRPSVHTYNADIVSKGINTSSNFFDHLLGIFPVFEH